MYRKSVITELKLVDIHLYSIHSIDTDTLEVKEKSFLLEAEEVKEVWPQHQPTHDTVYKIFHYNSNQYIEYREL